MKKLLAIMFLFPALCLAQQASRTADSAPAAGSQATASASASPLLRNVADMICWSGGATSAPSLTHLTVVLRDGATGAGTVLATFAVLVPASTGQNVLPFCAQFPRGVRGSANTAMTAEWSGLLANEFEAVTLYYHTEPK